MGHLFIYLFSFFLNIKHKNRNKHVILVLERLQVQKVDICRDAIEEPFPKEPCDKAYTPHSDEGNMG